MMRVSTMPNTSNDRKNLLAVNLSLSANVLLAVVKTAVGILGRSPALLADGIMSVSDVVYLLIVRIFMRLAGKPPDREHPYGHRQFDSIAAVVVGAFVVTTGVAIFFAALREVYHLAIGQSQFGGADAVALWVALFTAVLKVCLVVYTKHVGRQTGSIAVLALARDHRNDIFSITTAAVGIYFGRAGHPWVDPLAAAVVALVILHAGVEILRESSADLMDVLPGKPVGKRIHQLLQAVPGIEQVEEIHVHRIGLYLLVDVTIGVDGTISVAAGDRIASQAEAALRRDIEYIYRVSVHYHPSRTTRVDQPRVLTGPGSEADG
jgi:cation diffusion facilitator family transporter